MKTGKTGEGSASTQIPGLMGLFALLFFFSALDWAPLIFAHLSSLLFFFAASPAVNGIGLFGLSAFAYLVVRGGEFPPDSTAILFSAVVFGLLLRIIRFRTAFYPSLLTGAATLVLVMVGYLIVDSQGLLAWVRGIRSVREAALEKIFLRIQESSAFGIEELVELKNLLNGASDVMMTLMPAFVCLSLLLACVISLKLYHLLRIRGRLLPETRELRYFTFNDSFIWALISGLLSQVLPLPDSIRTVLFNILVLVVLLYLLRGMAVGVFWLRKRGFSMVGIGAVYVFLFALLPPLFILSLLLPGVLDTWFDFRSPGEIAHGH